MKKLLFLSVFLVFSCSSISIIEKERNYLAANPKLTKTDLFDYFGLPDDSIRVTDGLVYIWDNLNGKMTLATAPPYEPLDSAKWFGKRIIKVLMDSNNTIKKYEYWDFTNPKDFEKYIF